MDELRNQSSIYKSLDKKRIYIPSMKHIANTNNDYNYWLSYFKEMEPGNQYYRIQNYYKPYQYGYFLKELSLNKLSRPDKSNLSIQILSHRGTIWMLWI